MKDNYTYIAIDFDPFLEERSIEKVAFTTEAQKEVWLSCMIGGEAANLAYNESVSLILKGPFNSEAFHKAVSGIVERHEALRSCISADGESLIIYESCPAELISEDISALAESNQQAVLADFIKAEMNKTFDLLNGPLFRFFLHRLDTHIHYFTLFKHHVIGDGWSTGVLLEDLGSLYNAYNRGLFPMLSAATQISTYATEERIYQQSADYRNAEQYWLNLYRNNVPVLDLPTDNPRSSSRSYSSNRMDFPLAAELVQAIRKTGAKAGCSLVNTLLSAFEIFLYKTTGQTDITVGLPTAGQSATGHVNLVGHCVNLLPLRSVVNPNIAFSSYLKERKKAFFDAYDHQRFTFGELVKKLSIVRDNSRIPLVPVMFNVDMGMDNAVKFDSLEHTLISNPRTHETFELFLNITRSAEELVLEWSFNRNLFMNQTIQSMMATFEHLLNELVEKSDLPLKEIPSLMTQTLPPEWVDLPQAIYYPKDKAFVQLIRERSAVLGDKTAVTFKAESITYRVLERKSNQLAHHLVSQGIQKGDIVALVSDRSIEMLIALLGIVKSGAAYLPLDPEFPEERIAFMIVDSNSKLLITNARYQDKFTAPSILPIEELMAKSASEPVHAPEVHTNGKDLAYILYTSGSTGKPKGVKVTHGSLTNFLLSMQQEPGISADDRLLAITTVSFDIAGLELYLPLISGASLILADSDSSRDGFRLASLIETHQVTIMQATPSSWRMLLEADEHKLFTLKALCGGETFPTDLAEKLLERCSSVWNMYGPTETTIWSAVNQITYDNKDPITIGHPIQNTMLYLLDDLQTPVLNGAVGEIFIAGDGVAEGYLNRPELTADLFLGNPFTTESGAKMYRTGDLGKLLPNGEIQCLGRKDNQVKIRGHRIELGEIEYQLSVLHGIKEAIVDAKPNHKGDIQLVAYLIGDRDGDSVSWKDRWDTIYDTGVEFNKSANLAEHQIDGSIHRQLENSEELNYQAEEWLKESIDRIRKINAKRIVEVGSGAGQILFELAPSTSYYLATDYAHTAIDKLSEQLAAHPDKWEHVDAKTAPADDFSGVPIASVDLVLINSVAQYFPDTNYFLNVLENAAKVVKPGGCIFIGDMQGKNSLEMCHAIDQFKRSSDNTSLSRFQEVVKNRVRIEEELVADPGFFYLLPKLIPAITAVDIQLRKGLLLNETTNYHYDIWLYVNSTHEIIVPDIDCAWDEVKNEDGINRLLTAYSGKAITITGIPNKRTTKDLRLSTILQDSEAKQNTIGDIRPEVEAESTGFLPDTFWAIGEKHGYDTRVRWSSDGTDSCFEAIFLPQALKNAVPAMPSLNTLTKNKKALDFIRQPNANGITNVPTELTKSWKNELSKLLPDYMVPTHYVAIRKFPLTPNKKVNRNALPAIDWQQRTEVEKPPKTDLEKTVASIWEDCLGITNIGLDDNFFDIGGHSLIAVKMTTMLEKKTGLRLPLTTIFRSPILIEFVSLIESMTTGTDDAKLSDSSNSDSSLNEPVVIAMTPSQKEIWLSCKIGGDEANLAYNQSFSIRLEGRFDSAAFQLAIEHVVARHEALRASVDEYGDQLTIAGSIILPILFEDLTSLNTEDEKNIRFKHDIRQILAAPFNLESGPLFKVLVHSYGTDVHYFSLVIHHIICDATSMNVLLSDISVYYNAFVSGEKPTFSIPAQLSDYAETFTQFTHSKEYSVTQHFWLSQYQNYIPVFNLPTDYTRPIERTYKGDHQSFTLDREYYSMLKQISKHACMSIGATFTALVEIFLYHRAGQEDITLGLTSAGQYLTGHTDMVGHCVNLLPLRSEIIPDQTLIAYLVSRKNYIYDVYEHQRLTFSELLRKLNIKRDKGQVPLVPFVLTVQMASKDTVRFEGLDSQHISNPRASHTFEILLNLTVDNDAQAMGCYWAYNTQLFKVDTIKRMMDELKLIIQIAADTPEVAIKDSLPLPNPFPEYCNYTCNYPKNTTLLDLFANGVKQNPERIAVQFADRDLSYKALDTKSTQLASYLKAKAPHAALVPIFIQPSPEMIIGILGILKSGKAYVPIDPEFPQQRVSHILRECESPMIISDQESVSALKDVRLHHQEICCLDNPAEACWNEDQFETALVPPKPEDNAYVIYTSGSTGAPKGVVIGHRSLMDYFFGLKQHVPVWNNCQSFALGSSIATDLGNTVLFGALISGSTLHVFRKERFNDAIYIKDYFEKHHIDCLKIVPSHWKYLSDASGGLFPRKLMIFGGELLPGKLIKDIADRAPDCTVVNHYGPTETTIGKLLNVVDKQRDYDISVPIGKPFSNTTTLVLNADMKFCPIGLPGELYIGGDGLAKGYHNNPELTASVFIPNPIEGSNHGAIYKTGDVVRWNSDGEIEYIGRNDDQVKIRGNRIELTEIQTAVTALASVGEALVLAEDYSKSEKRLVAYIVPTTDFISANAIKELKSVLPEYMIPRIWIEIEGFPRMLNGKIDRKRLPPFIEQPQQQIDTVAKPTTATEQLVVEIWKDVLGIDNVGINDDFFELGGHSLIAVKVVTLVAKQAKVSVPFSSLFTFSKLADFASFIENEIAKLETTPSATVEEEKATLQPSLVSVPITEPQQEIWLACKMGGERANKAYTLSHTIAFKGSLDLAAIKQAVNAVITKHDSLRAVFGEDGQTMVINTAADIQLDYQDISSMGAHQKTTYTNEFEAMNRNLPFNLEVGPLVRFAVLKTASDNYRLYLYIHHIICDGWSLRIILKDLSSLYSAFTDNIDFNVVEAPSFGTYAETLHQRLTGPTYTKTVHFWKEQLIPLPPPLDLPLDFARPEKRTYNSRHEVYQISNDILDGLKRLGKDANCSLAITLRVAFETLLYRLTNQADLVVGLPISGQITENLDNLVGHCVFLLPVRARLHVDEPFMANLKTRKNEILRAYDHHCITFGSLIRELSIPRDESRIPLIPIVLNIHMDDLGDHMHFSGLTCSSPGSNDHETFNGFEMSLSMINTEGGLKIEWLYNQDLFNKNTIDSFQERFEFMLSSLVANPMLSLNEIPLVNQRLLRKTLANWNNTYEPYDKDSTLHQLISECAAKFPDRIALSYQDQQIAYRELEEESNKIARFLIEQGIRVGDTVGVAVGRSISMTSTLIAIMKAGAIYLPFETSHPKSRIEYILKEASAKYLITSSAFKNGYSLDISILLIEDILYGSNKLSSNPIKDVTISGDDLAYILHTSGSTGRPKGVKIRHRNVVNFLMGMLKRPGIQPDDRLLAVSPVSFDIAILLYLPLVCGAEVVIADEESSKDGRLLHQLMVERNISWMIATPATWRMIIESGWDKSLPLLAISAGEALSKDLAEKMFSRCSSVWNGYGPTETTVMVLMKKIISVDDPITLGSPLNNTSIYIVDKLGQLVPIGQEGEILIGGDGVGAGYHNLPDLTAKSFIKANFPPAEGGTFYRTGDLGKHLPNGEVLYLGRNDLQVKVRGHRIELGEIEQTLLQIDVVKAVVVNPFGDTPDNMTLVGYIILEDEQRIAQNNPPLQAKENAVSRILPSETEVTTWSAYLRARLPHYMVPHEYLILTEFPLTENGKVDRKKLPPPIRQVSINEQADAGMPTTITEVKLVDIWKSLLKTKSVGINNNFFHLGGHSLMAVKMMVQIEREIGERLPISSLIDAPTIAELAKLIEDHDGKSIYKSLVPIKSTGNKPPLYVVHGAGLNVLFFQKAVNHLDPEQPAFALQAKGLDGSERPDQTIIEIAADYIQEILQHRPDGPYALSGYSYGGIVAVEMAKQLKEMGKEVMFVGLFDTYANKTAKQFVGDHWQILKHQLKKAVLTPILIAKNPYLYAKSNYFLVRAHLRHLFKWIFPNKRLLNETPRHISLLRKQHLAAMNAYDLSPYDGSITLFKSKKTTMYVPYFETNGWQPYIRGGIQLVEIPSSHGRLFREPAVYLLSKRLQEQLDESYEAYQSKNQTVAIIGEEVD